MRIGILLNFRKGWMGGILYIINLVNTLDFLADKDKPEIIVFYNPALEEFTNDFRYPYLRLVPWNFPGFIKGYFLSWLKYRNMFIDRMARDFDLSGIYPLNDWPISGDSMLRRGTRVVAWIPDLQHKFYPHFFTRVRVFFRERRIRLLLRNTKDLVVSSGDVEVHFRKYYKIHERVNIHVLRFVSIINDFSFSGMADLMTKYKIPEKYFIVSNQFTNHKNHPVILRALIRLKSEGVRIHFVFTGKMEFKGNEKYIAEIRSLIAENQLDDRVCLLGVIPRQDQLSLMKHSLAVVQPSLFEGWSTVIEDAKSLGVGVIASSLAVNKEQLMDKGIFFNPHDDEELAKILASFARMDGVEYEPYTSRVRQFAMAFVNLFRPDRDPNDSIQGESPDNSVSGVETKVLRS